MASAAIGCVYVARCAASGGEYVGITTLGFEKRKMRHLSNAAAGVKYGLYSAIRKYGSDAFLWEIISDGHTWEELCQLERDQIALRRSGGVKLYNMTKGGDGTKGWQLTPEISARMSAAGKRRFDDPAQREWNRAKSLGKKNTPEQRQKISQALNGRTKSEEVRARMSEAQRKAWEDREITPELRRKMSDAAKRNVLSPEARAAISAKLKGIKRSPETIQKMREARQRQLGRL